MQQPKTTCYKIHRRSSTSPTTDGLQSLPWVVEPLVGSELRNGNHGNRGHLGTQMDTDRHGGLAISAVPFVWRFVTSGAAATRDASGVISDIDQRPLRATVIQSAKDDLTALQVHSLWSRQPTKDLAAGAGSAKVVAGL